MKTLYTIRLVLLTIFIVSSFVVNIRADEKKTIDKNSFLGYFDKDNDGSNDLFRDRNGDGINDMNNQPYKHNFGFVDKDGDGINDLFVDVDGDGVNDLLLGNGEVRTIMIDANDDGINDLTGKGITDDGFYGSNYGYIDEWRGINRISFKDENRDGIDDRIDRKEFFDRDGDGIDDRHRMAKNHGNIRKEHFHDRDGDGFNDCDGIGGRRAMGSGGHHGGQHHMADGGGN